MSSVYNYIEADGDPAEIKRFLEFVGGESFDFEKILPTPQSLLGIDFEDPDYIGSLLNSQDEAERQKGRLALVNKATYGFCGWRGWRKCHWGVEYPADTDLSDLYVDDEGDHFSIEFDTEGYPRAIAKALFVLFPEINFSWNCTWDNGIYDGRNGQYMNLADLEGEGFGSLGNHKGGFPQAQYRALVKQMF
jgi:hypothetical protein